MTSPWPTTAQSNTMLAGPEKTCATCTWWNDIRFEDGEYGRCDGTDAELRFWLARGTDVLLTHPTFSCADWAEDAPYPQDDEEPVD